MADDPKEDISKGDPRCVVRPMHPDEIALAKGIFGKDVDVGDKPDAALYKVQFCPKEVHPGAIADAPRDDAYTSRFIVPVSDGKPVVVKNLASESESTFGVPTRATLAHELTHNMQNQAMMGLFTKECKETGDQKEYHYSLTPKSKFEDFCEEQQAAIVQDYTGRYLTKGQQSFWEANTPAKDALLKKVVEDALPDARAARLDYQKELAQEKKISDVLETSQFMRKCQASIDNEGIDLTEKEHDMCKTAQKYIDKRDLSGVLNSGQRRERDEVLHTLVKDLPPDQGKKLAADLGEIHAMPPEDGIKIASPKVSAQTFTP